MNCGLRHFRNDMMQLCHRHAPMCAKFSFSFLKKVVRGQRWPTTPFFVLNISPFGEFTAPLRHILPIRSVRRFSSGINPIENKLWHFLLCNSSCWFVTYRVRFESWPWPWLFLPEVSWFSLVHLGKCQNGYYVDSAVDLARFKSWLGTTVTTYCFGFSWTI